MSNTHIIQVPVVIGKGEVQVLVVKELTISPPGPPIWRIKDIDKEVVITNLVVIPVDCGRKGKIIFNGFIIKNINYKTVEDVCHNAVSGPLFHFTTKIPFEGFIEITPEHGEKIKEGDRAEVLEAFVEGEKDELLCPEKIECEKVFNKILEKMLVFIKAKIVRIKEIKVQEVEKDCEKTCDKTYEKPYEKPYMKKYCKEDC